MNYLFTSESVSEGHPDKVADQISDAILDAYLAKDPESRVAVETLVTTGMVVVSGEVRSNATIDTQEVVREVIREIGYTKPTYRFDADSCGIMVSIHKQSDDIAMGVDEEGVKEQGAGDQGMMFGYASKETPNYMPLSIQLSHDLVKALADVRKNTDLMPYLAPDSKSQVTIQYNKEGEPIRVHTVVISTQHDKDVTQEQIRKDVIEQVIRKVVPAHLLDEETIIHVNPTGKFVIGGPHGDTGLTGRKIIVDTYGGHGAHGGGAFSGKDSSKVDRSAAYAARHIAKNLVASGLAEKALVQLAYAIGVAEPVSIHVNTYGTGKLADHELDKIVAAEFQCKPADIVRNYKLKTPIFRQTAAYGHFGRDGFAWEELDKVEDLKKY